MKNVVILSIISVHHLSLKSDPTYTRVNSKVPLKKLEQLNCLCKVGENRYALKSDSAIEQKMPKQTLTQLSISNRSETSTEVVSTVPPSFHCFFGTIFFTASLYHNIKKCHFIDNDNQILVTLLNYFFTSCLSMRLSLKHHKELRMYGAITNSALYVTVTVTFSCQLAHMAVTRNFHVGLTYVHLRTVPKCTCSLSFLFATDLLFLVFPLFFQLSFQLESPSLVPLGWKLAAFYIHVHVQFMAILSQLKFGIEGLC